MKLAFNIIWFLFVICWTCYFVFQETGAMTTFVIALLSIICTFQMWCISEITEILKDEIDGTR